MRPVPVWREINVVNNINTEAERVFLCRFWLDGENKPRWIPLCRQLLGDLRAIRTRCNENMLAIGAHHGENARH